MSVLYFLVPLMLGVATGAVISFVWAARAGQLDDLDTPPLRMLADDLPTRASVAARSMSPPTESTS